MVITDRQQDVLNHIRQFQTERGFGPTVREICAGLGLSSPGSLIKHLRGLENEGLLAREPGKKRTWKLIGVPASPSVPLLGRIAAGSPILAQENRETDLPIDPTLFGCDTAFALRVQGDSLIEAHVQDGDLAIIKPQEEIHDGQIAAVLVEGLEAEATLKVLRRRKGRLELHAANSRYLPLIFEGPDRNRVRILGRLVGVIRSSIGSK